MHKWYTYNIILTSGDTGTQSLVGVMAEQLLNNVLSLFKNVILFTVGPVDHEILYLR